MIVSMWMSRELLTVTPETPVAEAATLMARRHIRRLPVVSQDGAQLVGIITATDVLHAFPPDVNPFAVDTGAAGRTLTHVSHLLRGVPLSIAPDAPIEDAAALMRERKVGGLPVVRAGRLVGLITESDIMRAFVSLFRSSGEAVRITFDCSKCADPFRFIADLAGSHHVIVTSLLRSQQDAVPVCVFRTEGPGVQGMVDALWKSGNRVLNVLASGPAGGAR
jgi:acetoin utilization protein AcuB